ncbi:MAG: NAD(+)/NADH kinase [Lachnospiraceae bacterium]|nr:NAD(+)/NADH kinase [Lachnospiraceae bacterium]
MNRFFIITNMKKDPDRRFTNMLKGFLELNGRKCIEILPEEYKNRKRLSIEMNPKNDCVIVIGGDGSVLRAAHLILGTGVPILGINLGTLGYLAEIEKNNWQEMIGFLLKGDYEIENRMMLEGRMVERNGVTVDEGRILHGLNEAVVRSSALRVLNFNVYVDGHLLNNLDADGIIISTATGSTAYNMSAGGPLVEPKAQLLLLTPICAHTLNTRSVVLSAEDSIVIEMVKNTRNEKTLAEAVFDGGSSFSLGYGDRIEIKRSEEVTNLVKLSRRSFLSTLHKKMSS